MSLSPLLLLVIPKGPLGSELKRSTVNKIDRKNKGASAVLANAPL